MIWRNIQGIFQADQIYNNQIYDIIYLKKITQVYQKHFKYFVAKIIIVHFFVVWPYLVTVYHALGRQFNLNDRFVVKFQLYRIKFQGQN